MAYSTKKLAVVHDADFGDCTNTGYTWTLFADGRVAAEYNSRWSGSVDGTRYTTEPGAVDLSDMDPGNPDCDAEALLTDWADGRGDSEDEDGCPRGMRKVRNGYVVR